MPGRRTSVCCPIRDPVFKGLSGEQPPISKPDFPQPVKAPEGAVPNILVILTDDVDYGASSTFLVVRCRRRRSTRLPHRVFF